MPEAADTAAARPLRIAYIGRSQSINALPVVEGKGRPVGALNIHSLLLLRAGLACCCCAPALPEAADTAAARPLRIAYIGRSQSINALPVVEGKGRPVGALNIHSLLLLRAGLACCCALALPEAADTAAARPLRIAYIGRSQSINALPVVEGKGRPVGALNIHSLLLLRAGLA